VWWRRAPQGLRRRGPAPHGLLWRQRRGGRRSLALASECPTPSRRTALKSLVALDEGSTHTVVCPVSVEFDSSGEADDLGRGPPCRRLCPIEHGRPCHHLMCVIIKGDINPTHPAWGGRLPRLGGHAGAHAAALPGLGVPGRLGDIVLTPPGTRASRGHPKKK